MNLKVGNHTVRSSVVDNIFSQWFKEKYNIDIKVNTKYKELADRYSVSEIIIMLFIDFFTREYPNGIEGEIC